MSKLKTIDICAEFGYEAACSIPYAYWLYKRGELGGVVTCIGMKLLKSLRTQKKTVRKLLLTWSKNLK